MAFESQEATLREIVAAKQRELDAGSSALDVAESAVRQLEDEPAFNAGRGSTLCADGSVEMSASIMCGATLRAGAVAGVRHTKNPIALARHVLEQEAHVFFTGSAADELAIGAGLDQVSNDYFVTAAQRQRWKAESAAVGNDAVGTVGAVALDTDGNVAAATSTGGTFRQRSGRVGDSAVIGAGTYAANDACAVACTGVGEHFIRTVTAFDVASRIRYKASPLQQASNDAIWESLAAAGGAGGLIAVTAQGEIALPFSTGLMFRGWIDDQGIARAATLRDA
jgi:beta-aspartyl-peptidase (threonine type)